MGNVIKKIYSIFKVAVFCILLGIVILKVQDIVTYKFPITKYKPFFEEEAGFDILMFGSSHMEVYISPMELWEEYGVTSYNFGNSAERLATTYWTIQNAVQYKKPKLIILDVYMFGMNQKYETNRPDPVHNAWDCFPLTKTKFQGIIDVFDDRKIQQEFVFPLFKFHSRWNQLIVDDFDIPSSEEMGLRSYSEDFMLNVVPQIEPLLTDQIADEDTATLDIEYLNKIIDFCDEQGIALMLCHNPYAADEVRQKSVNLAKEIAEMREIPFLDFVAMNTVIDTSIDMYNDGHVNASGMRKVTNYVGDYIMRNYDLEDKRENTVYRTWHDKLKIYKEFKILALNRQTKLENSLMLLHDDDISAIVSIKKDSLIYNNKIALTLLQNINRRSILENETIKSKEVITLEQLLVTAEERGEYVLVANTVEGTIAEYSGILTDQILTVGVNQYIYSVNSDSSQSSLIAHTTFDDMNKGVEVNKESNQNYFAVEEEKVRPDIQFAVINNSTGNLIMIKQFWIDKSDDIITSSTVNLLQ